MDEQNGTEILTKNDTDKTNTLSSFFSSVFTTEECEHIPLIEDKKLTRDMNNIEINEEKVKKVSELNISKSPGPDSMHPQAQIVCTLEYSTTYARNLLNQ